jgi:hypothetical protein
MDPTGLTGSVSMQNQPSIMTINQTPTASQMDGEEQFSEEDIELAKQFISMVGDAERAISLLEKTVECQECLGVDSTTDTPMAPHTSGDAMQIISNFMGEYE